MILAILFIVGFPIACILWDAYSYTHVPEDDE